MREDSRRRGTSGLRISKCVPEQENSQEKLLASLKVEVFTDSDLLDSNCSETGLGEILTSVFPAGYIGQRLDNKSSK